MSIFSCCAMHVGCTVASRKDVDRCPHFSFEKRSVCTYRRRASRMRRASSRSLLTAFASGGAQTNRLRRRRKRSGSTSAKHCFNRSNIPTVACASSSRHLSSKAPGEPGHLDRLSMRSWRIFSRSTADRYSFNRSSTLYFEIPAISARSCRQSSDVKKEWKRSGYRSIDSFAFSSSRSVRTISLKSSHPQIRRRVDVHKRTGSASAACSLSWNEYFRLSGSLGWE
jgi:hypothetical protein